MDLLTILYWVILVIAALFSFVEFPSFPYGRGIVLLVLFIIIGLKVFRASL